MMCFVCELPDPDVLFEMDIEGEKMVVITCCGGCLLNAYIKARELWGEDE
jgi:hypothetical protein